MASLEERYKSAQKGLEEAKNTAKSVFKYNSEQIEMILGRAERTVARGDLEKVHGYGSEIKGHAEKIDETFEAIAELTKSWKDVEEYRDDTENQDLFDDNLSSFERDLKDFQKRHKLACWPRPAVKTVVARAMRRAKQNPAIIY